MSTQMKVKKAAITRGLNVHEDETGLERLIFFSDAVFAIAITLLALEIRLPVDAGDLSNGALLQQLLSIGPKYLSYIISFLVIGNFWIWHHVRFRQIVRYDRRLFLLNLLLLMSVAFIPFPTEVISENGNLTATIFYAITIAITGLLAFLLWVYASHGHRLTASIETAQSHRYMMNSLITPVVFLASIGLAFIHPDLAKYSWILTALAILNSRG
jgi:uncharacterized membrane protein